LKMYFTVAAINSLLLATTSNLVNGFTNTPSTFVAKASVPASKYYSLSTPFHNDGCLCSTCDKSPMALHMSEVVEEVPAEVEAIDGVESSEEAHNNDRPSRSSGIQKHKKGERSGTPLADLEVGSTVEGKVKTVMAYGAFVDIGAETDALLHVSRLSTDFVSDVNSVVKAGDAVSVRIVEINAEKKQVAISMLTADEEDAVQAARDNRNSGGKRKARPQRSQGDRQAQVASLMALSESGFDSNKMVEGEVVNTLDFGAFVRFDTSQLGEGLEGELDGLVHISSLCTGRASSVESVVKKGDKVQVRIKSVDTDGKKVSLSMITAEEEQANRPQRNAGRRNRMFSEDEMGAKDWKESLEKFQGGQPTFENMPVIVDKRK